MEPQIFAYMKHMMTLVTILVASSTIAQFSSGRNIVKDEATGLYYVSDIQGVIWVDDGMGGFINSGVGAGANSIGMMIANSKMYITRFNTVKVYDLQPSVQLDTTWTFSVPLGVYMNGICWDGNNTLWCHDQTKIYQVDMTTGVSSAIHTGIPQTTSAQGMEYDPLGDRLLMVLRNNSIIMGYDLQSSAYDTIVDPEVYWGTDITRTCDDQWLLIAGGSSTGLLYTLPSDLSHVGDTLTMVVGQPHNVHYDQQNDEAVWLNTNDSILYQQHPCQVFTSVEAHPAQPNATLLNFENGQLELTWKLATKAEVIIDIRSVTGQLVHQHKVTSIELRDSYKLQLPQLTSGMYFVNLHAGPMNATAKFIAK